MNLLNQLHLATMTAQRDDDLPDFLAARIFAMIDNMSGLHTLQGEVEELIEQLALYDTYGQTGYIGMGVNNCILESSIDRLERLLQNPQTTTKE